ncbi:hypothetical protein FS749_003280 [Ceratobasidium sp. UAMH 11750]|nr:hypothetical protein FS749_003280 [Ceratobasidium sp. UAMH 11750]
MASIVDKVTEQAEKLGFHPATSPKSTWTRLQARTTRETERKLRPMQFLPLLWVDLTVSMWLSSFASRQRTSMHLSER